MVRDHCLARVRFPPTSAQPLCFASRAIPRPNPRAAAIKEVCGMPMIGTPSAQRNQRGRAPAAARSLKFIASAFQPASSALERLKSKWTPSSAASVVAKSRIPGDGASCAQSSPGPRTTPLAAGPRRPSRESPKGARKESISANSPGPSLPECRAAGLTRAAAGADR